MFALDSVTTARSGLLGQFDSLNFVWRLRIVGSLKFSHSGCCPIWHREIFPHGGRSVIGENPTSNVLYSSTKLKGLAKCPYIEIGFMNGLLTFIRWLANFPWQYRLQVLVRLIRATLSICVGLSGGVAIVSSIVSKYTHPLFGYTATFKPTASFRNSHTYPVVINEQWVGCFDNYVIPLACLKMSYARLTT